MSWTTDYPTEPGFYWIRNYVVHYWNKTCQLNPCVVEVDSDLEFFFTGDDRGYRKRNVKQAEWQGPIEPEIEKPISPMCYSSIKIACRECGETDKRSFVSWKVGEADGKPMYGIICRECWIKRLTPEQRKLYMV